MQKIFKYPLEIRGVQRLAIPQGATPLCVQMQHGAPFLWALVDPSDVQTERQIAMFGTGQEMPNGGVQMTYLGTIQVDIFVWHYFWIVP
jgi:hypothetical protein